MFLLPNLLSAIAKKNLYIQDFSTNNSTIFNFTNVLLSAETSAFFSVTVPKVLFEHTHRKKNGSLVNTQLVLTRKLLHVFKLLQVLVKKQ